MTESAPRRRMENPAIFVCDLQEKFRNAIYKFDQIVLTTKKVLSVAEKLQIPVFVTTQNQSKLGTTVSDLQPFLGTSLVQASIDKTRFSMWVPELASAFHASTKSPAPRDVVLVGIETHICITQTTLDLLAQGHRVYVLADGVSSCNPEEVGVALARLRGAGAIITTSESWIFECMGDAGIAEFKGVATVIKETKEETKAVLKELLPAKI
ncbi:Isochorismatase hydrolase [Thozetella sp. PMI_491]|nr:Isochorismatase hydrolase [Thozetella sp. PMI_491]